MVRIQPTGYSQNTSYRLDTGIDAEQSQEIIGIKVGNRIWTGYRIRLENRRLIGYRIKSACRMYRIQNMGRIKDLVNKRNTVNIHMYMMYVGYRT